MEERICQNSEGQTYNCIIYYNNSRPSHVLIKDGWGREVETVSYSQFKENYSLIGVS